MLCAQPATTVTRAYNLIEAGLELVQGRLSFLFRRNIHFQWSIVVLPISLNPLLLKVEVDAGVSDWENAKAHIHQRAEPGLCLASEASKSCNVLYV